MHRPTRTAADWRDRMETAVRRQVQAERMADYLEDQPLDPTDVFAEELRNGRRAAAKAEAQAWAEYAVRCEQAFRDAADHEMQTATPLVFGGDAA